MPPGSSQYKTHVSTVLRPRMAAGLDFSAVTLSAGFKLTF